MRALAAGDYTRTQVSHEPVADGAFGGLARLVSPGPYGSDRRGAGWQPLVRLFLLALAVQVVAIVLSHVAGLREPFFKDAVRLDEVAREVAQRGDVIPPPSVVRLASHTQSYGPYYLLSLVYSVVGQSWLWARLVLGAGAALAAPAVYALLRDATGDRRAAQWGFWVTALWPPTLLWTASGVKDGVVTGVLLVVLAATNRLGGTVTGIAVGVVGSGLLLLFRPFAGAAAFAAVVAVVLLQPRQPRSRSRTRTRYLVAFGGVALFLALPASRTLVDKASLSDEDARSGVLAGSLSDKVALAVEPGAVIHGAATPAPWLWDEESVSPLRWIYPSTAVWILSLPLVGAGAWWAVRQRSRPGLLLATAMGVYLAAYQVLFAGDFARQRSAVEPLGMTLAILAVVRWPRQAAFTTAAWAAVVCSVALAQVALVHLA